MNKPVHTYIDTDYYPSPCTPRKTFCVFPEDWGTTIDDLSDQGWTVDVQWESDTFGGYAELYRGHGHWGPTFGLRTITHSEYNQLSDLAAQLAEPF
jgi:hypothetical protein